MVVDVKRKTGIARSFIFEGWEWDSNHGWRRLLPPMIYRFLPPRSLHRNNVCFRSLPSLQSHAITKGKLLIVSFFLAPARPAPGSSAGVVFVHGPRTNSFLAVGSNVSCTVESNFWLDTCILIAASSFRFRFTSIKGPTFTLLLFPIACVDI